MKSNTDAILKSLFVVLFLSLQHTASGQVQVPETEYKQAINFCPIALFLGIYSANYERMLGEHSGLMIRYDYESIPKTYSDANINANSRAAILNYRYHLTGGIECLFVGAFARHRYFYGSGVQDGEAFDFNLPETTVGLNVGKRWIFKSGFNINVVWGYGVFMDNLNAANVNDQMMESIEVFKDQYDLYNGMYGELSIGWAF